MRLVQLQWSKDEVAFSLHVSPSGFTLSGIQQTDLLNYLGFARTACPFLGEDAYCREVGQGFDLDGFAEAVARSYAVLEQGEKSLNACGFILPQPEGIAHFYGRPSRGMSRQQRSARGDGHTSPQTQPMKEAEDDFFQYAFTWIAGGSDKGWTTHYRLKHNPASPEIVAALRFLSLEPFDACPEFDFEPCYWRFSPFNDQAGIGFGNTEFAHRSFDASAIQFSSGLKHLIEAHTIIEPFGMGFLPLTQPATQRQETIIKKRVVEPRRAKKQADNYDFDVALSFAGTNRDLAEQLATLLKEANFSVFYDSFYPEELWGKNLADFFDDLYRNRARHCVILVSQDYVDREWTNHERQSAQARRLKEKGSDYILPIKTDGTELPGMPPTVGYLSIKQYDINTIASLLIKKLSGQ